MDTDIDFGFLQAHRMELEELRELLDMPNANTLDEKFVNYAWCLVDGYTTCSSGKLFDVIQELQILLDA